MGNSSCRQRWILIVAEQARPVRGPFQPQPQGRHKARPVQRASYGRCLVPAPRSSFAEASYGRCLVPAPQFSRVFVRFQPKTHEPPPTIPTFSPSYLASPWITTYTCLAHPGAHPTASGVAPWPNPPNLQAASASRAPSGKPPTSSATTDRPIKSRNPSSGSCS